MILDLYPWDTYYLFWTLDGGAENVTRILDPKAAGSGTVDHDFPAQSGGFYTFQVQGCPVPAGGPRAPDSDLCSARSFLVTATATINATSVRKFLVQSGVDPKSAGLRSYGTRSVRDLLNGN